MKYFRKNAKLEDYFEGEKLEKIKRQLEEADEEIANGKKTYTLEEVLEELEIENKEEFLEQINKNAEMARKKYIEKCKKAIRKYEAKFYIGDAKQYIG